MLSAMFSGRHKIATDHQGNYFIDRDPKIFRHVLNYLRDHKLHLPTQESKRTAVFDEFDYFCVPLPTEYCSQKSLLNYKQFGHIKSIGHGFQWIGNIKVCGKNILACGDPRPGLHGLLLFNMESNELEKWLKKSILSSDMNGNTLVAGGIKNIWIIDVNTGIKTKIKSNHDHVDCIKIYDGRIITGSRDATIKMWDLLTGNPLDQFNANDAVHRMDIAENMIATSSNLNTVVQLWDYRSTKHLSTLDDHTNGINCVKICKEVIVTSSKDNTIKIWDIANWNCLRTLNGHEAPVRSLCVYNNVIVSGSDDTTIKIWNLNSGECYHSFPINCMTPAVDANEDCIIGISQDGAIKIWKGIN